MTSVLSYFFVESFLFACRVVSAAALSASFPHNSYDRPASPEVMSYFSLVPIFRT